MREKLWMGKEKEGSNDELRLFVDDAYLEEIEEILVKNKDIRAVYFGHKYNWNIIESLYKKIRCIVEVDSLADVPIGLRGRIEIVLRIPNWVAYVKMVDKEEVYFVDIINEEVTVNIWHGRKLYDEDKAIR